MMKKIGATNIMDIMSPFESSDKLLKNSLDLGDRMIEMINNLNEENRELKKIIFGCLNLIDISLLDDEKSNKMKEILERLNKIIEV